MKKKAFTLIELLAIIVILAIIMVIAIPAVNRTIENRRKDSFFIASKSVLRNLEYQDWTNTDFTPKNLNDLNITGLSSSNYDLSDSYVYLQDGIIKVNLAGTGKFEGLYVCGVSKGSLESGVVSSNPCNNTNFNTDYVASEGVNKPKLAPGMTAIKWNSTTSTWDAVTNPEIDTSWYDYQNKIWGNARTADGSMWVWIPRYIYRISNGWHTATAGTIDIQFSMGTDDTRGGTVTLDTKTTSEASNNNWTNHPAFTFGTEITGFWMAKFEPSAVEGTTYFSCDGTDNVTTKTVKIIPNAQSWRCIQFGTAFTVSRGMETKSVYGWGTTGNGIDTHLIKGVEWGAVSYLSKSIYGQNTNEIWENPSYDFITGCAGNNASTSGSSGCLNAYNTPNGVNASTTGTIYGVYDMSGNSWEATSAYVDNGNPALDTNGASIISADPKYKDIYSVGTTDTSPNNYNEAINKKGDAVYETSSQSYHESAWFGDHAYMPYVNNPWIIRSGDCDQPSQYQGLFLYSDSSGASNELVGFRPVLLVGNGL